MNLFEIQLNDERRMFCEFADGQEVRINTGTYYLLEKATDIAVLYPDGSSMDRWLPDPDKTVFLDIESTGLRPSRPLFLVGLLICRQGQFILRQYLARHPQEEGPLLRDLAGELAEYKTLVTYNGKRFDMPYIENRMACYGETFRWHQTHLDLLWLARSHYRGILPDCRLVTLEEHILGLKRQGDVPGSRIPQVYGSFVKKQQPALMRGILDHNALDLISLYKLLPILCKQ